MPANPLSLRFTDEAREQVRQSAAWLLTISSEAAGRFSKRLDEELAVLRQSLADDIALSENGRLTRIADSEA